MRYIFKVIKILFMILFLCAGLAVGWLFLMKGPQPTEGAEGEQADSYARMIQSAVNRQAWTRTGVISWSIFQRQYLWDLRRGLVRVKTPEYIVYFSVSRKYQAATTLRGKKIAGGLGDQIIEEGYRFWLRDRFILEPTQSFFDEGVRRFLVSKDTKEESLFINYTTGGVSPGDSYQWRVNSKGMPQGVRVWSEEMSFLKGVEILLSGWKKLDTGLKVATKRTFGPMTIEIQVQADFSLKQMMGNKKDPFTPLDPDPFEPAPSSQPNVGDDKQAPVY